MRLQHAPRAHRSVRRHHVRVVAPQVALEVGDAIGALVADPVLGHAVLALLRHAEPRHDEQQLLLVALIEIGRRATHRDGRRDDLARIKLLPGQ